MTLIALSAISFLKQLVTLYRNSDIYTAQFVLREVNLQVMLLLRSAIVEILQEYRQHEQQHHPVE